MVERELTQRELSQSHGKSRKWHTGEVQPFPDSAHLELNPGAQWLSGAPAVDGSVRVVLMGGSPLTMLSLRPKAEAIARGLLQQNLSVYEAAGMANVSVPAALQVAQKLLAAGVAEPRHAALPHRFAVADCTVVIPAHNEVARIAALVHQLSSLGVASIVVVDDGSLDNTGTHANSAGATVIRNPQPLGPGAARNRGAALVSTSMILFIDADVVLPDTPTNNETWLNQLLIAFDDSSVAIAAPRITSARGTASRTIARYEHTRSPLDLGPQRATVKPKSRVAYVPSTVLAVRADHFHELGGFDESLRYGEDVDFVWRSGRTHQTRYEGDVTVPHLSRPSLKAFAKQRFCYGTSAAALDHRHPGHVVPFRSSGWSVAVWTSALLGGAPGVGVAAVTTATNAALLSRKLKLLAYPVFPALRLTVLGHFGVGRQLASAVCRAWLPLLLPAALVSRRVRRSLLAAVLLPALSDWNAQRATADAGLDPIRFTSLRALDEASYCAGVWAGCLRAHRFHALLPDLSNWPNRSGSGEDDEHG
jgi:mycofactocin glycosyltransferase